MKDMNYEIGFKMVLNRNEMELAWFENDCEMIVKLVDQFFINKIN